MTGEERHARRCECAAGIGMERVGRDFDDARDLETMLAGSGGDLETERSGAEDHETPPLEGPVALQQAESPLRAHDAGLLPAGKAEAEIACSGRENQAIETHQPRPL